MTLVRIVKNWDYPDLMQQSPRGAGVWDGIQFTLDPVKTCDALVVLNHVRNPIKVACPPENIIALAQEPPTEQYRWLQKGFKSFARVYTPDTTLTGTRYIHSHGALPWHIGRSYDFLKDTVPPVKSRSLSSIASRETGTTGKKARALFLDSLSKQVQVDLWGHGFTPIEHKWDALAPYRYALAIENYSGAHYWTEKISDCFLAWTMPIYHGATNITEYFPPEALIQIDIAKPEEARTIIEETIQTNRWQKNRDAMAHARELVLEQYQLFPFITRVIHHTSAAHPTRYVHIPANLPPNAHSNLLLRFIQRFLKR